MLFLVKFIMDFGNVFDTSKLLRAASPPERGRLGYAAETIKRRN